MLLSAGWNVRTLIMRGLILSSILIIIFGVSSVRNGSINTKENAENTEIQGLYSANDKIVILNKKNFNENIFKKKNAWLIEFYNSWCGFCKKFAPEWKEFAADVSNWKHIVAIGAIDCADDENNYVCRNYEIMAYPSIKYFKEEYQEGPQQLGEAMVKGSNAAELREILVQKLQQEQNAGRGKNWPQLLSKNYSSLSNVWNNVTSNVKCVFLIIEPENSTLSSEVILDLNLVFGIAVKGVLSSSPIMSVMNHPSVPSLVVVGKDFSPLILTPRNPSRISIRKAILMYMQSENFILPSDLSLLGQTSNGVMNSVPSSVLYNHSKKSSDNGDVVYQTDLETGLRYTLYHEITKLKLITGNALIALQDYLQVIIKYFPFTANGKIYLTELRNRVMSEKGDLTGEKFASLINELEEAHAPVYSTISEWVGCKGSAPHYRGFTCSLWTMFHVLTVNAAEQKTTDASEVLRAMHGYVKYFFGCTDCSQHFQEMAERNRLFSVGENDGAVMWLWIAHNEVNHRLAGDSTEDPQYPKKQFPVVENCPKCWLEIGTWDLAEVLKYLKTIYRVNHINLLGAIPHPSPSSIFSKFDMAVFIGLYIYFAVMLIIILRMFLIKKIYRKKAYKHDTLGKV